jgi:NADPH:quinone reductase-like Zn-dependent oxidoreductase
MPTQQKALWLKEERAEFELGPKPIDAPGPGELLVKVEATALNPVGVAVNARRTSRSRCFDIYRSTGKSKNTESP